MLVSTVSMTSVTGPESLQCKGVCFVLFCIISDIISIIIVIVVVS